MGPDSQQSHPRLGEGKAARPAGDAGEGRAEAFRLVAIQAEYRADHTSQHVERVAGTAAAIAERLGLGSEQLGLVREAAALHDVGNLAIPDTILLKPNKLTEVEYELVKTHTTLGARLLSESGSPVLQMASVIAAAHHERWDGRGYPAGLAGEDIPLVARVVAVADVFDALTHDRPYKSLWPVEQAISEIQRGAGTQFDPRVVDAFLETLAHADLAEQTAAPRRRESLFRAPERRLGGSASQSPPRPARQA
jgi:putative two-component system response regulator